MAIHMRTVWKSQKVSSSFKVPHKIFCQRTMFLHLTHFFFDRIFCPTQFLFKNSPQCTIMIPVFQRTAIEVAHFCRLKFQTVMLDSARIYFCACFPLIDWFDSLFTSFTTCFWLIRSLSPVRGLVVSASPGRVLPRPCKLVLQPSYQTHGVRKSCRELTQNNKKASAMETEIVQTQSRRYKTIVVIKRQQQTTISNKSFAVAHSVRCTGCLRCLFCFDSFSLVLSWIKHT